jgi:NADPH-dependent curcumin reductase CurA
MSITNRQIHLAQLPDGALAEHHFTTLDTPWPTPGPGEVLLKTILISVDPANRAWMNGPTYRPQISAGELMPAYALAEVVDAGDTAVPAGTIVFADTGWQEWAAIPAQDAIPIPIVSDLSHHLSTLGMTGLTAYFGLLDIGRVKAGETVVVTAAAGATGNVAGQLARIKGARVIGVSGSDEKNALLERELGFDATLNHRSPTLDADLAAACPDGIDVYFDNVGGPLLNTVLELMNLYGRVVCCGSISQYDAGSPPPGPREVPMKVVTHRLRLEGFIILDYFERWTAAAEEMAGWVRSGELKVLEDVIEGLDAAPQALIGLLNGANTGKRMVRVAPDPVVATA